MCDVVVEAVFDGGQCPTDWDRRRRLVGFEQGGEQSLLELGVEDCDADALVRDHVGVGALEALDEAMEAQASQVVAHLGRAVGRAEESGHLPAKALVGETGDGTDDEAQGTGQGHHTLIPEAQSSGSLALIFEGLVDALEERRADGTALAGTFDPKESVIDHPPTLDELGKMAMRDKTPRSDGLLMTVSIRRGLPSLRYCLTRLCRKLKSTLTSVPGVKTRVRKGPLGSSRAAPADLGREGRRPYLVGMADGDRSSTSRPGAPL